MESRDLRNNIAQSKWQPYASAVARNRSQSYFVETVIAIILVIGFALLLFDNRLYVLRVLPFFAKGSAILATTGCQPGKEARIILPTSLGEKYMSGSLKRAIVSWNDCMRPGALPVFGFRTLDESGSGAIYAESYTATVSSLWSFSKAELDNSVLHGAGYNDAEDYKAQSGLPVLQETLGPTNPVLVDLTLVRNHHSQFSRRLPQLVTFAKNIKASEIDVLLQKNAVLIDTRRHDLFEGNHHPFALNIPYEINGSDWDRHSKFNQFVGVDHFNIKQLPEDLNKSIIFSGESEFDFAPVRALLFAYHGGWKNLYWNRGGEVERLGSPSRTPEAHPGIRTVSVEMAKKIMEDPRITVVDARLPRAYAVFHLPRALNLPYDERSIESRLSATMDITRFKAAKDAFDPPPGLGENVLVYGRDLGDFGALKAAIWLKESAKNVMWLRGGSDEWLDVQYGR